MSVEALEPPSLIVTIQSQGIAVIELNRPRKRNALSQGLIDELTGALGQLNRSPTVLAAILTSTGPFCGMSPECRSTDFPELTWNSRSGSWRTVKAYNGRGVSNFVHVPHGRHSLTSYLLVTALGG
jgi:hypothetical protein